MFVPSDVARERYAICKSCDEFNVIIKTCKQCGCFMPAKSNLAYAVCPIGKWTKFDGEATNTTDYRIED